MPEKNRFISDDDAVELQFYTISPLSPQEAQQELDLLKKQERELREKERLPAME